jgi:4-hydroxy-tetrahydrodipicolinate synthase
MARHKSRVGAGELRGPITAMVTPFRPNGALDTATLEQLLVHQARSGIVGVTVCSSSGEGLSLSPDEFDQVVRTAAETVGRSGRRRPRLTVVAATGAPSTSAAADLTERAAEAGADAALVVAPYYQRPRQSGIVEHFMTIADEGFLPLIVYNSPERTGSNIEPETIKALAEHPNIVGIKEASADFEHCMRVSEAVPDSFTLLAGRDGLAAGLLLLGWHGVVSVIANLVPDWMVELVAAAASDDVQSVRRMHAQYRALLAPPSDSNPTHVKAALSLLGRCTETVRAPLTALDASHKSALRKVLAEALPAAALAPGGQVLPKRS